MFSQTRQTTSTFYQKLHRWTGLYLAIFLLIHLSAVLGGRLVLHLNTNFYFGVVGLNTFPSNLFFAPYYGLSVLSFFGHIAAVHTLKMQHASAGLSPVRQVDLILLLGVVVVIAVFYGLTNGFLGMAIPAEYEVLTGR